MTKTTLKLNQITTVNTNPRKTFDEKSIEGLAQSLLKDGLLQNLVVAKPKGKKKKYEIICGERRYRALSLLAERGDITNDYAIAVEIKEGLSADEILRMATVENVQRENLPPLEEAQAIAGLIQDGEALETITSQTGLGVQTIKRRLSLLDLCNDAQEKLRAGEINISQAEALSIGSIEDQSRILRQIENGWCSSAEQIKESITGRKPSVDIAIFDLEHYKGTFTADLFAENESTFFDDIEQFDLLQRGAIEALIEKYETEYDFVEFVEGYFNRYRYQEAEEGQTGGAVIVLHTSGEVEIFKGIIQPEIDQSNVVALQTNEKSTYGKPLVRYMSMQKSLAIQTALLDNPRKAKELIVSKQLNGFSHHAALLQITEENGVYCPALEKINNICTDLLKLFGVDAQAQPWFELGYLFARDIGSAYSAVQSLSDEQLDEIHISLSVMEFGQELPDKLDTNNDSLFNRLAKDLGVDMREHWRPDEAFLKRRNREQLMDIISDAGCSQKYGSAQGYKKGELVESMAKYFRRVLALEAPNEDELKAIFWLPEAMQFPAVDPDIKEDHTPENKVSFMEDEDIPIAAE